MGVSPNPMRAACIRIRARTQVECCGLCCTYGLQSIHDCNKDCINTRWPEAFGRATALEFKEDIEMLDNEQPKSCCLVYHFTSLLCASVQALCLVVSAINCSPANDEPLPCAVHCRQTLEGAKGVDCQAARQRALFLLVTAPRARMGAILRRTVP